ncbi:hypothetical protein EI94DRAFT_1703096 [Lactarius quietus]|nr:hypothetical protein EI94DRAFT_1703096 [Lactarius quietus]
MPYHFCPADDTCSCALGFCEWLWCHISDLLIKHIFALLDQDGEDHSKTQPQHGQASSFGSDSWGQGCTWALKLQVSKDIDLNLDNGDSHNYHSHTGTITVTTGSFECLLVASLVLFTASAFVISSSPTLILDGSPVSASLFTATLSWCTKCKYPTISPMPMLNWMHRPMELYQLRGVLSCTLACWQLMMTPVIGTLGSLSLAFLDSVRGCDASLHFWPANDSCSWPFSHLLMAAVLGPRVEMFSSWDMSSLPITSVLGTLLMTPILSPPVFRPADGTCPWFFKIE